MPPPASTQSPKKRLCILGATGSIGQSTLDVVAQHPDKFEIVSAAASSRWEQMSKAVKEFQIPKVCMWFDDAARSLEKSIGHPVLRGMEGLLELVTDAQVDYVVNGLVGAIGCEPTLQAIRHGKHIGLANKETMVMAGDIINRALREHPHSQLIPIDSEHSAIFQCLAGRPSTEIEKVLLTASGGPFLNTPVSDFKTITVNAALNHPTWNMGPKITIDSATMMNKGLEIIEAHYLFNVDFDKIDVVIHPSSMVHSFLQFQDGSLMAQLGSPDMRLPIQYAMTFPERWPLNVARLSIHDIGKLEFFPPDPQKFPCIRLAYEAGQKGGTAPAIVNATNEVAVSLFLEKKITFLQIPDVIEQVLHTMPIVSSPQLSDVLNADRHARAKTRQMLGVS